MTHALASSAIARDAIQRYPDAKARAGRLKGASILRSGY
jgi:hypothetical protein